MYKKTFVCKLSEQANAYITADMLLSTYTIDTGIENCDKKGKWSITIIASQTMYARKNATEMLLKK